MLLQRESELENAYHAKLDSRSSKEQNLVCEHSSSNY